MTRTPFEKHVTELLGHIVYSHSFRSFEAKERCVELLHKLREEPEDETPVDPE